MNLQQAIFNFWSGFGLTAYDETAVPDDAKFPYITYESVSDFWGASVAVTASLWYRSTKWKEVTEKEQEIAFILGRGGKLIRCDEGGFWIKRAKPWAQRLTESEDRMIRRIVLNCEIEFII